MRVCVGPEKEEAPEASSVMFYGKCITPVPSPRRHASAHSRGCVPNRAIRAVLYFESAFAGQTKKKKKHHTSLLTKGEKCIVQQSPESPPKKLFGDEINSVNREKENPYTVMQHDARIPHNIASNHRNDSYIHHVYACT